MRRSLLRRVISFFTGAFLLTPTPSLASQQFPPARAPILESQPPPIEEMTAPDRWKGKAEVSYVGTSGNAETNTASVGTELQYDRGSWSLFLRGAFLFTTSTVKGRNHRVDGLLRGSRAVGPRLEIFSQITYLKNTFAGLDNSFYPLAGLAYDVIRSEPHTLTTRLGFGYGQESRLRQANSRFATADAQTAYRWALSKTTEFHEDAMFTSNLSRSADWRFANTASIAAALNSLLSLKVSHAVNYLNEPVTGFERLDTVTSAALVATF